MHNVLSCFLHLIYHEAILILVFTELPHFFLQLYGIPLYSYNVIYSNSLLLMDTGLKFYSITNDTAMTLYIHAILDWCEYIDKVNIKG